VWMPQSAINEGFAVCQARLGAKIHDAKDPASDLGPMFRQVVGTLFGLAGHYADRWIRVRGSHPIPEYGFERVIAPEPIEVNHAKLVDTFEGSRLTQRDVWAQLLADEQLERVMTLEVPDDPPGFHFPAELWIRCLYDALVAFHRRGADREQLLAALTPLYFGRTAGFISDTLEMTTDQAERVIDDQARQFEELKPYLVGRWRELRTGAS
jgi:glucosylglycerate synthase